MRNIGHFLAVRGRYLHVPLLFTVPGMPLIGVLLSGGDPRAVWPFLLPVCGSAVFSTLFALPVHPDEDGNEISLMAKRTMRIVSAILALLFSSVRPETFTTVLLILLLGALKTAIARINFLCAACTALHYVLLMASGMALLPLTGLKNAMPFADIFAACIFFYIYGTELAGLFHTHRPLKRPGGLPMFLGACAGYLTVFFCMSRLRFHGFLSYIPGVLSAIFAGIFLFLAWKAWQVFRKKSLPGIAARWAETMRINLIFIQAAAAASAGFWKLSLALLTMSILSRVVDVKIKSELDHGE